MTTIITKNGSGAPTAGQLSQGELAVDLTNKELYTKDSGGNVIKVGAQGGSTGTFTDLTATSSFTSPGIDDNANATAITIDASENVGIGTSDPSAGTSSYYDDLVIKNATSGSGAGITIQSNSTNGFGGLDFRKADGTQVGKVFADNSTGSLGIETGGVSRVNVTGSGNIGIGTSNPLNKLVVAEGTGQHGLEFAPGTTSYIQAYDRATTDYSDLKIDAQTIAFGTDNGTERMRISSTGNVGIGTTSPNSAGNYYDGWGLSLGADRTFIGTTQGGDSVLGGASGSAYTAILAGGTERMRINSAGNVGIGETNPNFKLDVKGSSASSITDVAAFTNPINAAGTGHGARLLLHATQDPGRGVAIASSSASNYAADNDMLFYTSVSSTLTERMRISSGGNVGIGTTSPLALFQARGENTLTASTGYRKGWIGGAGSWGANSYEELSVGYNGIRSVFAGNNEWELAFTTGTSTGFTSGQQPERMRIDSSGNLLVGTTDSSFINGGGVKIANSQAARLKLCDTDTAGTGSGDGMELTQSGTAAYLFNNENSFLALGTNALERMRIDSTGNLLVGKTATNTADSGVVIADISAAIGQVAITKSYSGTTGAMKFYYGLTEVGRIDYSDTTTTYITSSDVRLKDNIVDAPAGNIDSIKVRSFDWKIDGEHQEYGFIAQELETVAPYAVSKGETDEDTWGVDYSKLVPMLVKEIQDLKAEVAALKGA